MPSVCCVESSWRRFPRTAADDVPRGDALPDHRLEQRQQAAAALFAIAELPDELREPATLFFVHECSARGHGHIKFSLMTVNNRLSGLVPD